jgi:hypothetical protein
MLALVSRCLSAAGIRFSAILSRLEFSPSYDRPTGTRCRTMTGFPRSAHARCGRMGRSLYPGTSGAFADHVKPWPAACRLSPARVLNPGKAVTYPRLLITRRHREFTAIRPPGLPLARRPRMTRELLRLLPWAPHPREQDPRTHARAGTGSKH